MVEISEDGKSIRRKGNKPLPAQTGSLRKRDSKAMSKQASKPKEEEKKVEEDPEDTPVIRDEHGRI